MRRGSQSPPLVVTKMLRFVSIEIMFRLMMTSLKTNRAKLATIIMSEGKSMDPYLPKIDELLEKWYPKDKTSSPEKQFEKLELMTGHDLLVITILAHAKVDSKKKYLLQTYLTLNGRNLSKKNNQKEDQSQTVMRNGQSMIRNHRQQRETTRRLGRLLRQRQPYQKGLSEKEEQKEVNNFDSKH
jgi:hypothetical protein